MAPRGAGAPGRCRQQAAASAGARSRAQGPSWGRTTVQDDVGVAGKAGPRALQGRELTGRGSSAGDGPGRWVRRRSRCHSQAHGGRDEHLNRKSLRKVDDPPWHGWALPNQLKVVRTKTDFPEKKELASDCSTVARLSSQPVNQTPDGGINSYTPRSLPAGTAELRPARLRDRTRAPAP